jgi:hypothetical protein
METVRPAKGNSAADRGVRAVDRDAAVAAKARDNTAQEAKAEGPPPKISNPGSNPESQSGSR